MNLLPRPKRALTVALAALALLGCTRSLPEIGSTAAQLYVVRCGGCHQAYAPRSLTASMWGLQLLAMRHKIAEAGQTPLTPEDEHAILNYLKRNAGQQ
jgi:mono/diheme cytochrome c family protein